MPAGTAFTQLLMEILSICNIADVTASNIGNVVPFDSTSFMRELTLQLNMLYTSDAEQRFILTDNRADTTTLRVECKHQLVTLSNNYTNQQI